MQDILPNYEVLDFIGRGGMGAVYKARQKSLNRTVALKLLSAPSSHESGLDFVMRFKVEAQAMARLSHPNIVPVHDFGETGDGHLFYVMELVEGADLAKQIESAGKLPPEEAVRIALAVCDALAFAHSQGVVHRDIKPSNILISKSGQVKVADFGLAKIDDPVTASLTLSGTSMGSQGYAAPEVFSKAGTADHRADIYSLGVALYEMLTGDLPRGMFKLPSEKVPGLDPRFDTIICKAMEEDRAERHQSVAELKGELKALERAFEAGSPARHIPRAFPVRRPMAAGLVVMFLAGVAAWRVLLPVPEQARPLVFQGHRYQYVPGEFIWNEAHANALSMGGHLATLTTQEENDWVWRTFSDRLPPQSKNIKNRGWWVGGVFSEQDDSWRWITGEPFDLTRWAEGEPRADRTPRLRQHDNGGNSGLSAWSALHYSLRCGFLVEWDDIEVVDVETLTSSAPPTDVERRRLAAWLFTLPRATDPVSGEVSGPDLLLKGDTRNRQKFAELPTGALEISRVRTGLLHVDDAALAHLAILARVHSIADLRMNGVDDAKALSCVRDLTRLYTLVFKAARPLPLPDAELVNLERLGFMHSLRLEGWSSLTGRGLSLIADKRRLSVLGLNACPDVNDEGLAEVARFGGLATLSITGTTKITDAGLQRLKKLLRLKTLTLADTSITPQGLADLKAALPSCEVKVLR